MADKRTLQENVRNEIEYLLKQLNHPSIHKETDLVFVFSGPGTFDEPLKEEDDPYMAWMDRYRVLYGANLVKHITAKRLKKSPGDITREDVKNVGPKLLYNGTIEENDGLRKAIENGGFIFPKEKTIIIDYFVDENGTIKPFVNTKDQIESITPSILEKLLPLRRVALVSHATHFPRILRYLNKFKVFPADTKIDVYALKVRKEGSEELIAEEMEKAWEYFLHGDLSWDPIQTS